MLDWLKGVFTNPDVLSSIKVTFEMAVSSTIISAVMVIGILALAAGNL